jgi:hypothetical protein
MEWTKEKLMKAFQHAVEISETKEEAFEMIDYLFYEHLKRDDLVDIIIDLVDEIYGDYEIDIKKEDKKPDLKIVH